MQYIEHELGLDAHFNPILYRFAKIASLGVEALIITPFELARKRMFVQRVDAFKRNIHVNTDGGVESDSKLQTLETCVQISPAPYTSLLHCIGSVISEEGGIVSQTSKATKEWEEVYGTSVLPVPKASFFGGMGRGVSSVYRGFWTRFAANVVEYCVHDVQRDGFL